MELYHNNMSVCAQKVRLVIHEKGLKPTEHHLNLRAGDQHKPEYVKLNPKRVVPTLVDSGQAIIESTVICEYLEDAYPENPLRPENLADRARMRTWTMKPDAGLHDACGVTSFAVAFRHQMLAQPKEVMDKVISARPDPQGQAAMRLLIETGLDAPAVPASLRAYDKVLGLIDERLAESRWLAGATYSLADAAMLPYVCRIEDLGLDFMWKDRGRPRLADWLARSKERPNYSGIETYLDEKYLTLMREKGAEARERIEAILKG